ncbi:nudix hydrolase 18, mitochondrial-like [Prosopis cineraria]|uniref:nudix hydrolase 18, mitochondrial-like n=1 Tax=Prosopis cineraria TaxID=364024 RepID=UPI00240F87F2|nr:nudix hydrolase 18, mitochondrial-like [Prosopis cineraria]
MVWLFLEYILLRPKKKIIIVDQIKKGVMGLFLSKSVFMACKFFFSQIFSGKVAGDDFLRPRKMVRLTSRTGRHLQRYDEGCRQVVGCIPYRYKNNRNVDGRHNSTELEVLMISAQNGQGMQFPKGGWEIDESMEQAALRETLEEAGVEGNVQSVLGKWRYKSKRQSVVHEGHMFPLLVNKQLEDWPEKNIRKRLWMSVSEAKEICPHAWMKEALDVLIYRQREDGNGYENNETCGEEEGTQVIDYSTS